MPGGVARSIASVVLASIGSSLQAADPAQCQPAGSVFQLAAGP